MNIYVVERPIGEAPLTLGMRTGGSVCGTNNCDGNNGKPKISPVHLGFIRDLSVADRGDEEDIASNPGERPLLLTLHHTPFPLRPSPVRSGFLAGGGREVGADPHNTRKTMHTVRSLDNIRLGRARPIAFSLLALAAAQVAFGQAAPATNQNPNPATGPVVMMDTFTVTGSFASSLAAAAQAKQDNPTIVEVIMAEDIGKLPDVSIADSLTRLTGLATQRTNGRSQAISIRGLTGDFSTGMLNGREQVSTGLNRAVEFDQYPAELLNEVVVYKSAAPSLTSQGLAGTIDMKTVKPLSKSGRTVAMNAYYNWTELGELTPGAKANGKRFNLAYIDQLDGGKVGVAFGYSHTSTPFQGQQFQAWGYDNPGGYLLGGTKSYVRSSYLERDGLMGVVEFKPSDNIHSTIDVYSSSFKEKQLLRGLELPLAPNWTNWRPGGTVLQPGSTVTNGLYTKAVIGNVKPVVRNDTFVRDDDLIAAGWNLKIGNGTGWTTIFDAGYSRVKRNDVNLETWSGVGFYPNGAGDTVTVELSPGKLPRLTNTLDYSNSSLFRLTDPQSWGPGSLPGGGMTGYLKGFQSKDELGQIKLLTKRELDNFFSHVEVGVSYTDRFKRDGEKPSGYLYNASGQPTTALPPIIGTTDLSFLGIRGGVYAYDPEVSVSSGALAFRANLDTGIIAQRWSVREKITRPYAQLDFDRKVGSVPMTGNIGFQLINVDQSSSGRSANGNTVNNVTESDKYTDFAPSLNVNFEPADRTYIRFSAARQIARPRMFDMKASRTWGYDSSKAGQTDLRNSPWSGSGGNTQLRPWKADSIDVSIEKYFKDNMGYVAVTGFHKKLLTYIYEQQALGNFAGYPVTSGPTPTLTSGTISKPVNGEGGSLKGLEFTISLPSELFNKNVKGFGVVFGGAYTDSSVQPWGPNNGTAPISGLSKKVANATVYFERAGFSARLSQRYRSEYRAYITTFGPPNFKGDVAPNGDFAVTQPETVVDAQVSYALQHGRLKGLTFFAQAYNLNDEPLITYESGDPRQVKNYQTYGASYSLGASYKF